MQRRKEDNEVIEEKIVWLLAALVKLHRGDRVSEAADVADKFTDEYNDRFDYEDEHSEQ